MNEGSNDKDLSVQNFSFFDQEIIKISFLEGLYLSCAHDVSILGVILLTEWHVGNSQCHLPQLTAHLQSFLAAACCG